MGRAGAREERVDGGGAGHARPTATTASGQLLTVKRGATVLENHTYDLDGNRSRGGAVYDDQDRLTTRGGVATRGTRTAS